MLLAEWFVLLSLNADGTPARGVANQYPQEVGVTGALVAELVWDGHVTIDDDGRIGLSGTVPEHPLLRQVLENVGQFEGRRLRSRLGSIKHSGWHEVVDGLIDQGVVGREHHRLRPDRHPVTDVDAHAQLLAEVRAAAMGDGPMSTRDAGLLAMAGPCQLLEVVAPDRSTRDQARRRIAEATEQVSAADAVREVVKAAQWTIASAASSAAVIG
jgi:hypothetical protein